MKEQVRCCREPAMYDEYFIFIVFLILSLLLRLRLKYVGFNRQQPIWMFSSTGNTQPCHGPPSRLLPFLVWITVWSMDFAFSASTYFPLPSKRSGRRIPPAERSALYYVRWYLVVVWAVRLNLFIPSKIRQFLEYSSNNIQCNTFVVMPLEYCTRVVQIFRFELLFEFCFVAAVVFW